MEPPSLTEVRMIEYIAIEGNQTLQFAGQTIQWSKEKKMTRGHEFKDIKGIIRIRKSKKVKQHNGQKKKEKRRNIDLQSIQIKTK